MAAKVLNQRVSIHELKWPGEDDSTEHFRACGCCRTAATLIVSVHTFSKFYRNQISSSKEYALCDDCADDLPAALRKLAQ